VTSTDRIYLRDSQIRAFSAVVVDVDPEGRVALDTSAFYPTGGGQPHDTGTISWDSHTAEVTDVTGRGPLVWHSIDAPLPAVGTAVSCELNWERRHQLMRTHTALHILCGVIWNEWGKPVTGGNMEPLVARMDFEFDPLPDGFADRVTNLVNAEISADRPIEVSFLPRETAVLDQDLIRTKVNLIPETVTEIRVLNIVGLDKQADGGTHVLTTGEVGRFEVVKTQSKGKGNKRLRIRLHDA